MTRRVFQLRLRAENEATRLGNKRLAAAAGRAQWRATSAYAPTRPEPDPQLLHSIRLAHTETETETALYAPLCSSHTQVGKCNTLHCIGVQ